MSRETLQVRRHRNRFTPALIAGLIAAALASVASAVEQTEPDPTLYPRIVNGVLTHDYPAVGAVLRGDFPDWAQHVPITADNATSFCSGTLIGCRTFLTPGTARRPRSRPARWTPTRRGSTCRTPGSSPSPRSPDTPTTRSPRSACRSTTSRC